MKNRLKRWWNVAPLWPICFCILFGKDVAKINTEGPLDLYELLSTFASDDKTKVVYPEVLPVIAAMLKAGVGTVVADSPLEEPVLDAKAKVDVNLEVPKVHARKRSLSLNDRSGTSHFPHPHDKTKLTVSSRKSNNPQTPHRVNPHASNLNPIHNTPPRLFPQLPRLLCHLPLHSGNLLYSLPRGL
jgi:hypothetical protein